MKLIKVIPENRRSWRLDHTGVGIKIIPRHDVRPWESVISAPIAIGWDFWDKIPPMWILQGRIK